MPSEGESNSVPVLEPSWSGRLILHYQDLELESEDITLKWLYYPDPNVPCVEVKYRVELYRYTDIMNADAESDLEPFNHFESLKTNMTLPSQLLMNEQIYFRISALNINNSYCARMEHFTTLSLNGSYEMVYQAEASVSFQIPIHLQEMNSLQLIWSKNMDSQCVCPLIEEIASCACNREFNTSNFVTISDGYLTVSNLTDNFGLLHFVTSGLSGCHNRCDIRSITTIYQILPGTNIPKFA